MFYKAKAKPRNTSEQEKKKNDLMEQILCQGKYDCYK